MNKEEKTFNRVLKMINDYNRSSYDRRKKLESLIRDALPSVKDQPESAIIADNLLRSHYNLIADEDIFEVIKYIVKQTSLRSWKTFQEYMNKMREQCSWNRLPKCCTPKSLDEFEEETLKWSLKESMARSDHIRIINADKKPFKFEPINVVMFTDKTREYLFSEPTDREYCLSCALRGDHFGLLIYIATDLKNGVIDARLFPLLKHLALDAKWDTRKLHSSTEVYTKSDPKPAPKELSRTYMLLKYMTYRFGACVKPDRNLALAYLLKCCCLKSSYGSFTEWCKDDWTLPYLQLLLDEYEYCHRFKEYNDVISEFFKRKNDFTQSSALESFAVEGCPRLIAQLIAFGLPTADSSLYLPQNILQYARETCTKSALFKQREPIPQDKITYYRGLTEFDIDNLSQAELAQMESVALTDTRCAFTLGSYYFEKASEGSNNEVDFMTSARFYSYGTGYAAYINRIICLENNVNMSNPIWSNKIASTYKEGPYAMCAAKYIITQYAQSHGNFDLYVKDIVEQYCSNGKDDKNAHLVQIAYSVARPREQVYNPHSYSAWQSDHRSSGDSFMDYMQYVAANPYHFDDKVTYHEGKYNFGSVWELISKYSDEIDEFEMGVFANGLDSTIRRTDGVYWSRSTYMAILDIGIKKGSVICKRLKAHFLCSSHISYTRMKNDAENGHYYDYEKQKDAEEAYEIILSLNGKYGVYKNEFQAIVDKYSKQNEDQTTSNKSKRSKRR